MNFSSKLQELKALTDPYDKIWQTEVLIDYPQSLTYPPREWLNCLMDLSDEELWRFDGMSDYSVLNNAELQSYLSQLKEACDIPKLTGPTTKVLSKKDLNNITVKKEHEINGLFHLFEKKLEAPIDLIDIGGGQGHLSRLLSEHFNAKATIFEQDNDLITVGKRISPTVNYHQLTVGDNINEELALINGHNLLVGLHTCGSLADHQIELAIRSKTNMVNVGCCYLKMQHPSISKEALTLASRRHGDLNNEDYQIKKRVKEFRYSLHLFYMTMASQNSSALGILNIHFTTATLRPMRWQI